MTLPSWLRGSAPSYGRPIPLGSGGTVVIRSTPVGAFKPSGRRVSVRPAPDPLAVSMSPVPGWRADAAPLARAA
jgi:hypothetical protein